MTLAELNAEVGPTLHQPAAAPAWDAVVDGWYDAQPREATQDEVDAVLARVRLGNYPGNSGDHELITRMWSEILRRRG